MVFNRPDHNIPVYVISKGIVAGGDIICPIGDTL